MINEKRVLDLFLEMVQINSETKNELAMQKYLISYLEKLGFEIYTDTAGEAFGSNANNVIAKKAGIGEPLILSAHMDTVTPGNDIEPVIVDEVIYSKRQTILGADDKAGIATILEAVTTLVENNHLHRPLEIVFFVGEEGGLHGSRNLDYSLISAKQALIFDSGGELGTIIKSAPGQDVIKAKIIGKPAHAGVEPENGISAIYVASQAIAKMNLFRIDEETTANIGIINGGVATNIIAPEVVIEAEARSLNEDKLAKQTKHMTDTLKQVANQYGATVEIDVFREYNGYVIDTNGQLLNSYISAIESNGYSPNIIGSGGGSDANNLNANNIETLNISVNMCNVHTTDEYIKIKDLVDSAKILHTFLKID